MRDIRDYQVNGHSGARSTDSLASPFNVKKNALTLSSFTIDEIRVLYSQHTEESGQIFENDAVERAWYWSEGQPWLVNALAFEVVVNILKNDFQKNVTAQLIDDAAERLIKNRDTRIESLLERLKEPRVARVMDSVFASSINYIPSNDDDRRYCLDLGLVKLNEKFELRPANAIYREVMGRVITDEIQEVLLKTIPEFNWTDGKSIYMNEILREFQKFWRKGALSFPKHKQNFIASLYDEALYSFILEAFLQRLLNSKSVVSRQFAEGRGAFDIGIIFQKREYIIEVKLKDHQTEDSSLEQLYGYLDTNGENEGWLIIFDRSLDRKWEDKIYWNTVKYNEKIIHVVGC
ncbi:MAG: hypothetical protein LBR53_09490 [Deltaproteobacteria bacterium]|jgi:hypothetical protein|nr:hypothetical protein [Deltaproteobacteria bacterium]